MAPFCSNQNVVRIILSIRSLPRSIGEPENALLSAQVCSNGNRGVQSLAHMKIEQCAKCSLSLRSVPSSTLVFFIDHKSCSSPTTNVRPVPLCVCESGTCSLYIISLCLQSLWWVRAWYRFASKVLLLQFKFVYRSFRFCRSSLVITQNPLLSICKMYDPAGIHVSVDMSEKWPPLLGRWLFIQTIHEVCEHLDCMRCAS
jgi:hypothetical protein